MTKRVLSEAEFEAFIDETERLMLGVEPGPNVNDVKIPPDFVRMNGPATFTVDPQALRRFMLLHGRAPTPAEVQKLRK